MSLFSKLDKKKTKEKAIAKLTDYRLLKAIAGKEYSPKVTTTYSFEPHSYTGTVSNPMEKHIIRQIAAQQELRHIEEGINGMLNAWQRQIIIEKYCKRERSDISIYIDLEYSESEFYRELEKALYAFAENYKNGELLCFIDGDVNKILGDFC